MKSSTLICVFLLLACIVDISVSSNDKEKDNNGLGFAKIKCNDDLTVDETSLCYLFPQMPGC
jgi:hypothetical protein